MIGCFKERGSEDKKKNETDWCDFSVVATDIHSVTYAVCILNIFLISGSQSNSYSNERLWK